MKIIVSILLYVALAEGQGIVESDEATYCLIGSIAYLPPKPIKCIKPNEVYACGYGEANCNNWGYCGVPPCRWR